MMLTVMLAATADGSWRLHSLLLQTIMQCHITCAHTPRSRTNNLTIQDIYHAGATAPSLCFCINAVNSALRSADKKAVCTLRIANVHKSSWLRLNARAAMAYSLDRDVWKTPWSSVHSTTGCPAENTVMAAVHAASSARQLYGEA